MAQAIVIRPVEPGDAAIWERMRSAAASSSLPRREPLAVLLACSGAGTPVGFVELSIRPYAEGAETDRVAVVEGWYVEPGHRGKGIGAALIRAAEEWGRAHKCTELSADTQAVISLG
jgi:aminoglycoside 6'-N-acetyltransferase I